MKSEQEEVQDSEEASGEASEETEAVPQEAEREEIKAIQDQQLVPDSTKVTTLKEEVVTQEVAEDLLDPDPLLDLSERELSLLN